MWDTLQLSVWRATAQNGHSSREMAATRSLEDTQDTVCLRSHVAAQAGGKWVERNRCTGPCLVTCLQAASFLSLTFLRSLFKGLSMVSFLPSPEANFPVLPILEHSAFDRRRPGGCMVRKSADESLNHLPFSVFSLRNLGRHLTNHWLCS